MLLTLFMVFAMLPQSLIMASEVETTQEQTTQEQTTELDTEITSTEETTSSEVGVQSTESNEPTGEIESTENLLNNLLDYIIVDKGNLTTPDTQHVVAQIGEDDLVIDGASLLYQNTGTGQQFEVSASLIQGNVIDFSFDFQDAALAGAYQLISINYTSGDGSQTIQLGDASIQATFGVNQTVDTHPDAVTTQDTNLPDEMAADVVTLDEYGNVLSEQNVQDAIGFAASTTKKLSGSDNKVVVLDPGHGGTDSGTSHNGIVEKNVNLAIALSAKAELETYEGVTVYLTRSTDVAVSLTDRVTMASNYGATVFISFHNNYSPNDLASGVEIYYPNQNYNPSVSSVGQDLANKILSNLVALGLNNGGTTIRTCKDNSAEYQYADGSQADYYSVIRNCKKAGIPGIIIEHAFTSNASDVNNFLSSPTQLQKMGVADATGIAQSLGLTKETEYAFGSASITYQSSNQDHVLTVGGIPGAHAVWLAVWSNENGQDDLKWYVPVKNTSGNWSVSIPTSGVSQEGMYNVLAYVNRRNNTSYNVGASTFVIENKTSVALKVVNVNNISGSFDVIVSNVNAPNGISSIQVPVWSKSDQSDIGWYTANKQSDGSYRAHVDVANHNCNFGDYQVHVYVADEYGNKQYAAGTKVALPKTDAQISATMNTDGTSVSASAWHVPGTFGASLEGVMFAVWSEVGGQDDLHFYNGVSSADKFIANIALDNHKSTGRYYVHCYAATSDGKNTLVGETSFTVNQASASSVEITNKNTVSGTFDIVVKGVTSSTGIDRIAIPVWSQSNQSDLQWYTANKQSDGSYRAHVDISNHNCNYGTYQVHTYLVDKLGSMQLLDTQTVALPEPATSVSASLNSDGSSVTAAAWHVPGTFGNSLQSVQFAVWSETGGQDDLHFYSAMAIGDQFAVSFPLSNHNSTGVYYVHTYAQYKNGSNRLVGTTAVRIAGATVQSVKIENLNYVSGNFDVVVSGVSAPGGVQAVSIPVWSASDQSDLQWYTASAQENGTYVAHVDIANHNCRYGTYQVHTYIRDGIGAFENVNAQSVNMKKPDATIKATASSDGSYFNISAWHVPGTFGASLKGVQFAVWSDENGQDDLRWYNGNASADSFVNSVKVVDHKSAGVYQVHAYAVYANGAKEFVGSTEFTVLPPSASSVEITNYNEAAGTFEVRVKGAASGSLIMQTSVAVWSRSDQGDIAWYKGTLQSDGTYMVSVDIKNHGNNLGVYNAHAYLQDLAGFSVKVGEVKVNMLDVNSTLYSIMGTTSVDAAQLIAYYNRNAVYPAFYGTTDAPNIESFVQIYMEECAAEGVKGEVAFCQAMKETGFMRYGGDVQIGQFNFAGLGATGNHNPGNSFASVRIGVRAQVQHLKAYASQGALNNPCEDSRFQYVTRGCAPYVEWLGISENPSGKGWATAKNYGYSIKNDYIIKIYQ